MVETMRIIKEKSMDVSDISFSPANLAALIKLTDDGSINSSVAKEVFEKYLTRILTLLNMLKKTDLSRLMMKVH